MTKHLRGVLGTHRAAMGRLGVSVSVAAALVIGLSVLAPAATAENHTVTASPSQAGPGDTITVSWTAPAGHQPSDWIDLYRSGSSAPMSTRQVGTSATSGSLTFKAPLTPGTYEFHYCPSGTSGAPAARSNTVTVH